MRKISYRVIDSQHSFSCVYRSVVRVKSLADVRPIYYMEPNALINSSRFLSIYDTLKQRDRETLTSALEIDRCHIILLY